MKKVYMFFANQCDTIEGLLNFKYFPSYVYDYVYGEQWSLYAFTTNKKYADSFFELRKKKLFHMTVRKMEDDEYNDFRVQNTYLELNEYTFENIERKVDLITTDHEFNESRHLWIDIFSEETAELFGYLTTDLIDAMDAKYIDVLNKLGLNAALVVVDDEFSNHIEEMAYQFDEDYVLSIPQDVYREVLGRKVIVPVSLASKTLNSFIHIFKPILNE